MPFTYGGHSWMAGKKGEQSPSWKGGRNKTGGGYIFINCPNNPQAIGHGVISEHRLIAQRMLGRLIEKNEVVHHKNGNKLDNREENLQVMSRSEHEILHQKRWKGIKK